MTSENVQLLGTTVRATSSQETAHCGAIPTWCFAAIRRGAIMLRQHLIPTRIFGRRQRLYFTLQTLHLLFDVRNSHPILIRIKLQNLGGIELTQGNLPVEGTCYNKALCSYLLWCPALGKQRALKVSFRYM